MHSWVSRLHHNAGKGRVKESVGVKATERVGIGDIGIGA